MMGRDSVLGHESKILCVLYRSITITVSQKKTFGKRWTQNKCNVAWNIDILPFLLIITVKTMNKNFLNIQSTSAQNSTNIYIKLKLNNSESAAADLHSIKFVIDRGSDGGSDRGSDGGSTIFVVISLWWCYRSLALRIRYIHTKMSSAQPAVVELFTNI